MNSVKSWAIAIAAGILFFILIGASRHLPTSDTILPTSPGDFVVMLAYMVAFWGGAASVRISHS